MGSGPTQRTFVLLWWHNQVPHVATMHDEFAAGCAANLHNAVIVAVEGRLNAVDVHDHWRRDDGGKPLPAKWTSVK